MIKLVCTACPLERAFEVRARPLVPDARALLASVTFSRRREGRRAEEPLLVAELGWPVDAVRLCEAEVGAKRFAHPFDESLGSALEALLPPEGENLHRAFGGVDARLDPADEAVAPGISSPSSTSSSRSALRPGNPGYRGSGFAGPRNSKMPSPCPLAPTSPCAR